jgi:hypothetical protein
LLSLNGWPVELSPRIVHGDIETPNLQELAGYVSSLVGAGALTPDAKLEEHMRELANLPESQLATARQALAPAGAPNTDPYTAGEMEPAAGEGVET